MVLGKVKKQSCLGFRDKAEQASDLTSNCLDTALTMGALIACCECKTCSTTDKMGDES